MSSAPEGFSNVPPVGPICQGEMAVRSGEAWEAQIETLFLGAGMHRDDKSKTLAAFRTLAPVGLFGGGFYARNLCVGICLFRRPLRLPFVVWRPGWTEPLGIELQSQAVSGSADAKLVKTVEDLCRPICPSVMVLAGRYFEEDRGIQEGVSELVANSRNKILRVFVGDAEFRRWVTQGMAWPASQQPELPSDGAKGNP